MEEINKFISKYREIYKSLENQKVPIEAIHIIEEELDNLLTMREACSVNFEEINTLDYDQKKSIREKIELEMYEISNKSDQIATLFAKSGLWWDSYMQDIFKCYLYFQDSFHTRVSIDEVYKSKNEKFRAAYSVIYDEREIIRQISPENLKEYKRILFKNDDAIEELYNQIKNHFSSSNLVLLKKVLNGGSIKDGYLIFHGTAKKFVNYIDHFYRKSDLISDRQAIVNWIATYFNYLTGGKPSKFKIKTVDRYFSNFQDQD